MSSLLKIVVKIYARIKTPILKILKRNLSPVKWENMRTIYPKSNVFGFDRGTPIDRVYTDDFLNKNKHYIKGVVCEIAENSYTKKFGSDIQKSHILHYDKDNKIATILGDLTKHDSLPKGILDCFICTVTLNFIYDYKSAIKGIYHMLKDSNLGGGTALVTVASLVQISKYDYDRWGDYWRFTDSGIKKDFEEVFGTNNIDVVSYGNLLTVVSELHGISAEELNKEEIFYNDPLYPMLICIKAKK